MDRKRSINEQPQNNRKPKIKLCGMMSREDVIAAVRLRPDYIGFILCDRFRRYIDPCEVAEITDELRHYCYYDPEYLFDEFRPDNMRSDKKRMDLPDPYSLLPELVGVFVDQPEQEVISLFRNGIIDIIQLHGAEDDDYIRKIQTETHAPVIKAFTIKNTEDVKTACSSAADMILLDAGTGLGITFDWELLNGIGRDYILAGGLNPGNVAHAIEKLHPYGVDVSSGIETDGVKDHGKMRAFVDEVFTFSY